MFFLYYLYHLLYYFWMIGRNIIVLMNIVSQIIQIRNTLLNYKFPISHPYSPSDLFHEIPNKDNHAFSDLYHHLTM